jgi:hypothetical protein
LHKKTIHNFCVCLFFKNYRGVFWDIKRNLWKVSSYITKKKAYKALFVNEIKAAEMLNYKCAQKGTKLKNYGIAAVKHEPVILYFFRKFLES